MLPRKDKVVIIGAGASGLFAARALKKRGFEPILIEKQKQVGGKCHTYSDPNSPELKTEYGATVIAPNYDVVLDAICEKDIQFEESVSAKRNSVGFFKEVDALSWPNKPLFMLKLTLQIVKFTYAVTQYQYSRDNLLALPNDFELPFATYAKKYGLEYINLLVKPLVTGFGYGAMEDIPTYCVMEFMGVGTLTAFAAEYLLNKSALVGIKGGFQQLMEKIAEDFTVITSATVTEINRAPNNIRVTYKINDEPSQSIDANALVLAISPLQWTTLGMKLTSIEQECINSLSYYRYPVAICKLKGIAAEHTYIPQALEKEGFGHLALITTRDNRLTPKNGRLCTAYINLLPGKNEFSLEKKSADYEVLKKELISLTEGQQVNIIDTKIWEDYMPTLSWQQRLKLEKEQMRNDTCTVYVGAYTAGGFEDVRCVANQANRAIQQYFSKDDSKSGFFSHAKKELQRAYQFFYSIPRSQPINMDSESSLQYATGKCL